MLKELIQRFSGMGSGLFRSPKKANQIIDEEILLTMKSISGEFKKDSLLTQIEEERLKISLEMEAFIKAYENGKIKDDIADLTISKLTQKFQSLENKVDELNSVREDIKAFDSTNKDKEQEFKEEMKKHKIRSLYEIQKGEYR